MADRLYTKMSRVLRSEEVKIKMWKKKTRDCNDVGSAVRIGFRAERGCPVVISEAHSAIVDESN